MRQSVSIFKPEKFYLSDLLFLCEFILIIQPAFLNFLNINLMHLLLIATTAYEIVRYFALAKLSLTTDIFILVYIALQWAISMILHSVSIVASIKQPLIILLTYLSIRRRLVSSRHHTLTALSAFSWIVIALNFFSVLLFPYGLFQRQNVSNINQSIFFFGVDNQFGRVLYPCMAIIVFFETFYKKKRYLLSISAIGMVGFGYFYRGNGAGIISFVIYCALLILFFASKQKVLLNGIKLSVLIIALNVLLLSSKAILSIDFVKGIFQALGKDTTLTGRTDIWDAGLKVFSKHPLIGIGQQVDDIVVMVDGTPYMAHNRFLQTLLEGGIVSFSLMILSFGCIIMKGQKNIHRIPQLQLLYIGFFATFFYFFVETASFAPVYMLMLVLSEYASQSPGMSYECAIASLVD